METRLQHTEKGMDLSRFQTINASEASEGVSSKYAFVPTAKVVNVMALHGWLPVGAQEQRCNNDTRKGFQKHLIRFRQQGAPLLINQDALFPEIVLTNSHDGLASFKIMAGIFRMVCINGLVVADTTFKTLSIRHIGYADEKVHVAIEELCDNMPRIQSRVKEFQAIELTPDEQGVFGYAAVVAKYGDIENHEHPNNKRTFDVPRLTAPIRRADANPTLWNTYNTVQEKLIKGGRFERDRYGLKRVRGVNSIQENTRINQALWALTEKMAELKTH